MSPKERYNPLQTLSTILEKHHGAIDAETMKSYLSYIAFLSLSHMYQNLSPTTPLSNPITANQGLGDLLNNFRNMQPEGSESMNPLMSLLGDKQGLSSLLSQIPPETFSQLGAMLGNQGKGGAPDLGAMLSGLGGGQKDPAAALGNMANMAPLLSMLGGGGGGANPLASILGGKKSAANPLAGLLGGGIGGHPLMSLLGNGGLSPLLSILGSSKEGIAPLLGQLGKDKAFMQGLGAVAPLMLLAGSGGLKGLKGFKGLRGFKGLKGLNFGRRRKRRNAPPREAAKASKPQLQLDQLKTLLGDNEQITKMLPLLAGLQAAGVSTPATLATALLPMAMQQKKGKTNKVQQVQQPVKTTQQAPKAAPTQQQATAHSQQKPATSTQKPVPTTQTQTKYKKTSGKASSSQPVATVQNVTVKTIPVINEP